jgi:hypothetical protein
VLTSAVEVNFGVSQRFDWVHRTHTSQGNSLRRIETAQGLLVNDMDNLTTHVRTQMSREETQKVLLWVCPQSMGWSTDQSQQCPISPLRWDWEMVPRIENIRKRSRPGTAQYGSTASLGLGKHYYVLLPFGKFALERQRKQLLYSSSVITATVPN